MWLSVPSVRKVRFGDGYSQRAPAGLNANLKTYSVTLSVPRWEGPGTGSRFWKSTGAGNPFCGRRLMSAADKGDLRKMVVAVSMLRVEFSAEFEQVVN
ncbi:phage tail protein [Escherichia coli]|uniref:phage tail protein n=1 Tax=Escherichia coli TaxID=562 RepID=UPI002020F7DB|nr:phage tail protein [Escherichia coli]